MPNDRLRDAMLRSGITIDDVAEQLDVDPKTPERWISTGRTPYRSNRHKLAAMVRESEAYLWPDALDSDQRAEVGRSELINLYPHRSDAPVELWTRLFDRVTGELDMLVYAGLYLPEQDPRFVRNLIKKARGGVKLRLLLGDPDAPSIARRGAEEEIGDALAYRVRNTLRHFKPLGHTPGIDVRQHETTLYNSVFRFDDEMLVTLHVYGIPGAHAPLMHLRRLGEGELFTTYAESFERVWSIAKPPSWP